MIIILFNYNLLKYLRTKIFFVIKMIDFLADRTIRGDFGNGQERRDNLGPFYAPVQNEVNRRLGYSKRHYW